MATDTYYASGILRGDASGRRYAFFTIFAKNERIFSVLNADFYAENGQIEVWDRPGMGVEINPEKAEPYLREEDAGFFA